MRRLRVVHLTMTDAATHEFATSPYDPVVALLITLFYADLGNYLSDEHDTGNFCDNAKIDRDSSSFFTVDKE